ncbi:unnamed protein product [Dovyalis caffra]|uniref:Uncharacterized protein n=1 Tax=Dovyalis caffra TaxID=77055 RepID=A0AAV1R779_9ROSI|nr:unnamed protein product [Dovyalis caffra]
MCDSSVIYLVHAFPVRNQQLLRLETYSEPGPNKICLVITVMWLVRFELVYFSAVQEFPPEGATDYLAHLLRRSFQVINQFTTSSVYDERSKCCLICVKRDFGSEQHSGMLHRSWIGFKMQFPSKEVDPEIRLPASLLYLAMSGLVDIWTSELAKLREKGQNIWSSGSSPTDTAESSKVVPGEEGSLRLAKTLPALIRGMRVNSPVLAYSEASLSMLIDCFSA